MEIFYTVLVFMAGFMVGGLFAMKLTILRIKRNIMPKYLADVVPLLSELLNKQKGGDVSPQAPGSAPGLEVKSQSLKGEKR